MTRLIFVNRVCWPQEEATAQLLINLVDELANLGWECHVVTESSSGDSREGNQVKFHPVSARTHRRTRSLLGKALAYRRFARGVKRVLPSILAPGDRVIAMTDPPLIGAKIAPIVRQHRAHLWHWVQDIYPEVAIALCENALIRMGLRRLRRSRNQAWQAAEHLVTIGADMADLIGQHVSPPPPVSILPNWYPAAVGPSHSVSFRRRWNVGDQQLLVVYSGNLGRAHTLSPVLEMADRCRSTTAAIRFVFVGEGARKETLIVQAKERGLSNVSFEPPVNRNELDSLLSAADAHLVTMRPECRGTVLPSKFYGIVAASRPCIFIGPETSDLATLIRAKNLGITCDPSEVSPAVDYLQGLAGNPQAAKLACRPVDSYRQTLPDATASARAWDQVLRRHINPTA